MTPRQAKKMVLAKMVDKWAVTEPDELGRYFIGVRRGKKIDICDAVYFPTKTQAQEMADNMNEKGETKL